MLLPGYSATLLSAGTDFIYGLSEKSRPGFISDRNEKLKSSRNHSVWEGQAAKTERIFRMRSFSDEKNQNLLLSLEDITDEKKKLGREEARAQQLQEDSQLYRMAVERTDIGLWKASLSKKQAMEAIHFNFSDKGGDIFGFVSFTDIGYTQFTDIVHTDSAEKTGAHSARLLTAKSDSTLKYGSTSRTAILHGSTGNVF